MGNTHKARIARLPIKERCANTQARGSPVTTASAVLVSEVRKESLTALVDTSLRSEVKMPLQGTRAMSEKMGRAINAPHSAARTTNPLGPEKNVLSLIGVPFHGRENPNLVNINFPELLLTKDKYASAAYFLSFATVAERAKG